jgi:hypothetical protein
MPYHFDRGQDGQFLRAPDYQRNRPAGMEGQVIAKHHFWGMPPFSANQIHTATESPATVGGWVAFIASWLQTNDQYFTGHPTVDWDYVPYSSAPCRYKTVRYWTAGYEHVMTCASHDNGGIGATLFTNAAPLVYEKLTSFCNGNSGTTYGDTFTYEYRLNDDGTFLNSNHEPYNGDFLMGPNDAASYATLPGGMWPPSGYTITGAQEETATVTSNTGYYKSVEWATKDSDPSEAIDLTYEFFCELSGGWSVIDMEGELDAMLAQVNLSSQSKEYTIHYEGGAWEVRALDPLGEQVTVTREGPNYISGTPFPVQYVITSNAHPWNWATNGPCKVAKNVNDIVYHWVDGGTYPNGIPDPPETNKGDILMASGDYWVAMKSVVRLPAGSFGKTVKRFDPPIEDSQSWTWPATPQNDWTGGGLLSSTTSTVTGSGQLVAFSRGPWINITNLVSAD